MAENPLDDLSAETGGVSIFEVFNTIKAARSDVILFVLFGAILGVLYLAIAPSKYSATMVIGPAQEQGGSGSLGGLSQLASLAGSMKLGKGSEHFDVLIDTLLSDSVAARLMRDQDFVHHIFDKEWDPQSQTWHRPGGLVFTLSSIPDTLFGIPVWSPPSANRLAKVLKDRISVGDYGDSGLKQLSVDDKDPAFAVSILQHVYRAADDQLKESALIGTERYIAYLDKRLADVMGVEHRQALIDLLADQERTRMLTEANVPYAAKVVNSATPTDLPSQPRVLPALVVSVLGGFFLGSLWAFLMKRAVIWPSIQRMTGFAPRSRVNEITAR